MKIITDSSDKFRSFLSRNTRASKLAGWTILALIAGFIVVGIWNTNQQNEAERQAESYFETKSDVLNSLQAVELSSVLQDDSLDRSQVDATKQKCEQIDQQVNRLERSDIDISDSARIMDFERSYPADALKEDAARYRDLCWYYITFEDYDGLARGALESDEHDTYLLDRSECQGDRCYKPSLHSEYHEWRTKNILEPYVANQKYYREAACPVAIDGGEQFCNAIGNYASRTADYEALYLMKLKDQDVAINDPVILSEYDALLATYESLQAITQAIGDYQSPNDVYKDELKKLEATFKEQAEALNEV